MMKSISAANVARNFHPKVERILISNQFMNKRNFHVQYVIIKHQGRVPLTHELSEEKSAKFDRVDHLWPHKAGD